MMIRTAGSAWSSRGLAGAAIILALLAGVAALEASSTHCDGESRCRKGLPLDDALHAQGTSTTMHLQQSHHSSFTSAAAAAPREGTPREAGGGMTKAHPHCSGLSDKASSPFAPPLCLDHLARAPHASAAAAHAWHPPQPQPTRQGDAGICTAPDQAVAFKLPPFTWKRYALPILFSCLSLFFAVLSCTITASPRQDGLARYRHRHIRRLVSRRGGQGGAAPADDVPRRPSLLVRLLLEIMPVDELWVATKEAPAIIYQGARLWCSHSFGHSLSVGGGGGSSSGGSGGGASGGGGGARAMRRGASSGGGSATSGGSSLRGSMSTSGGGSVQGGGTSGKRAAAAARGSKGGSLGGSGGALRGSRSLPVDAQTVQLAAAVAAATAHQAHRSSVGSATAAMEHSHGGLAHAHANGCAEMAAGEVLFAQPSVFSLLGDDADAEAAVAVSPTRACGAKAASPFSPEAFAPAGTLPPQRQQEAGSGSGGDWALKSIDLSVPQRATMQSPFGRAAAAASSGSPPAFAAPAVAAAAAAAPAAPAASAGGGGGTDGVLPVLAAVTPARRPQSTVLLAPRTAEGASATRTASSGGATTGGPSRLAAASSAAAPAAPAPALPLAGAAQPLITPQPSAALAQILASLPAEPKPGEPGDSGMCLICWDRPRAKGFVHGGSLHQGYCAECCEGIMAKPHPRCPHCNQEVDAVLSVFG